ncbi:hypothetical protein GCM10022214_40260 [Actinomadura miaoliensis]|uniref:Uncharacterized protein n=1 Tax=Actinomadura miaoliensis TaxID=430685 RepID=A0ABP7W0K9_9ACTN
MPITPTLSTTSAHVRLAAPGWGWPSGWCGGGWASGRQARAASGTGAIPADRGRETFAYFHGNLAALHRARQVVIDAHAALAGCDGGSSVGEVPFEGPRRMDAPGHRHDRPLLDAPGRPHEPRLRALAVQQGTRALDTGDSDATDRKA